MLKREDSVEQRAIPGASNMEQCPGNGGRCQGHPRPWTGDTSFLSPLRASHRLQLKDQSVPPWLRRADRTLSSVLFTEREPPRPMVFTQRRPRTPRHISECLETFLVAMTGAGAAGI